MCVREIKTIQFILLLIFFSWFCPAFAQTYSFKHYSFADRLLPSGLMTVFQDSKGYMWFGGAGGACKYDGSRFIPYLVEGDNNYIVKRISEDRDGTIWILTDGHGIAKVLDKDVKVDWIKKNRGILPTDHVNTILFDKDGNTWIGTWEGLVLLHPDNSFSILTKESGLHSNRVNDIIQDHEEAIWIATGRGVTRFTIKNGQITSSKKIHDACTLSLEISKDGTVYFGTMEGKRENDKGVFSYKNGFVKRILSTDQFPDPIKSMALLEDSGGDLWIGTTHGCILYRNNEFTRIRLSNGLSSEDICQIIEDREGNLWFATGNGAMKLSPKYTVTYNQLHGLLGQGIFSMLIDSSENIWCGGWSGLYKIGSNGRLQVINMFLPLINVQVWALAEDDEGTIWIGTFPNGLIKYKDGKFSKQFLNSRTHQYDKILVSALETDIDGSVWVGLHGEILNINSGIVRKAYRQRDGIPDTGVYALLVDSKGSLWFGTDGEGVGLIKNGLVKMFSINDVLPNSVIEHIAEDSEGRIWIGTRKGTVYWSDGKFHQFNLRGTLHDDFPVRCIFEDKTGHLWFGTSLGIYEWSDSVLFHYDLRDGFAGDVSIFAEDKDGNLWVGAQGICKFNRAARLHSIPQLEITIERIYDERGNKVLTSDSSIPFEDRTVTFLITSLSFIDEENMEFQYILNGFEENWNQLKGQRIIRYTLLPANEYSLLVRGRNRNGNWSKTASYSFEILPPYWQTWWFRISAVLFLAGISFFIYKRRINNLIREKEMQQNFSKQLIESQETERKRIAGELHDGIGQNLLVIKNRAKMALKEDNYKKQVEIINDIASESIEDVRNIAYNLHPYFIDEVGITASIKTMINKLSGLTSIRFVSKIENIDKIFPPDKEINIFRIVQEGINNIIKHSKADEAYIGIVPENNLVKILIKDNGIGIPASAVDLREPGKGFGLKGISERVKFCGGGLSIESDKGTTMKITIAR